jgi:hypothetical protein
VPPAHRRQQHYVDRLAWRGTRRGAAAAAADRVIGVVLLELCNGWRALQGRSSLVTRAPSAAGLLAGTAQGPRSRQACCIIHSAKTHQYHCCAQTQANCECKLQVGSAGAGEAGAACARSAGERRLFTALLSPFVAPSASHGHPDTVSSPAQVLTSLARRKAMAAAAQRVLDLSDDRGCDRGDLQAVLAKLAAAEAHDTAAVQTPAASAAQQQLRPRESPGSPDSASTALNLSKSGPSTDAATAPAPAAAAVQPTETCCYPPPGADEGPEVAAEYEAYAKRWAAGSTLQQRWQR